MHALLTVIRNENESLLVREFYKLGLERVRAPPTPGGILTVLRGTLYCFHISYNKVWPCHYRHAPAFTRIGF